MKITKELMSTDLITIRTTDRITDAYKLMHEKGIRHLPVMDERNVLVGILSDRDIQRAMNVRRLNNCQQEVHLDASIPVEDFMSWPVYTVNENATVRTVAEQMLSQKVSSFLVQAEDGRVKGIITTDDLLKLFLMDDEKISDTGIKALSRYFMMSELN